MNFQRGSAQVTEPVHIDTETIEAVAALAVAAAPDQAPGLAMGVLVMALVMLDDLYPNPEAGGIEGLARLLVETSKQSGREAYQKPERLQRWEISVNDKHETEGTRH